MQQQQTKADPSGMTTRKAKAKTKTKAKDKDKDKTRQKRKHPPPDYPNEHRALIGDPVGEG